MRRASKVTAGESGMTQEEVAEYMGMTRARVSQLEIQALKKLRKRCQEMGIEFGDDLAITRE